MLSRRKRKPPSKNPTRRTLQHNKYAFGVVQKALSAEWKKRNRTPAWPIFVKSAIAEELRSNTLREVNRLYDSEYGQRPGSSRENTAGDDGEPPPPKQSRRQSDKENPAHTISDSDLSDDSSDMESLHQHSDAMESENTTGALQNDRSGGLRAAGGSGGGAAISLGTSQGSHIEHMSFSKSRVWYSYAYATTKVKIDDRTDGLCTSLALIPVDLLSFYLSPAEFSCLPSNNVWVKNVTCTVKNTWCPIWL